MGVAGRAATALLIAAIFAAGCGTGGGGQMRLSLPGRPAHLTSDLLQAACNSYFVNDREVSPVYA